MLSLCSKSYIIEDANGKQKLSFKGIAKTNVIDPMKKFEESLGKLSTIQVTLDLGLGTQMSLLSEQNWI